MRNLAGMNPSISNETVRSELTRARINIHDQTPNDDREVNTSMYGKLGAYKFTRAWSYWVVEGLVPLELAQKIYKDPIGKTDIRVDGHVMKPPPEQWVTYYNSDGKIVVDSAEYEKMQDISTRHKMTSITNYVGSDTPAKDGQPFVTLYHIDSEIGLRVFADYIRQYYNLTL